MGNCIMKHITLGLIASFLLAPAVFAQGLPDPVRLEFSGNHAEITDRIEGKAIKRYVFSGTMGEQIAITLDAPTPSANYNVQQLDSPTAFYVGSTQYDDFSGTLPADADYEIRVYLMGQASETGGATYTLTVSRQGDMAAPTAPEQDFADGLMGGPDFWEVTDLKANGSLNVRSAPSTSADVVTTLVNGAIIRNFGCEKHDGMTWCQIGAIYENGFKGWAASQYLKEASAPPMNGTDIKVEGTNYDATGKLPCTIAASAATNMCDFGVTRGRPGLATLFITRPDASQRVIEFSDGEVKPMSGVTAFSSTRAGDETTINVDNGAETYVVPDAVVMGG